MWPHWLWVAAVGVRIRRATNHCQHGCILMPLRINWNLPVMHPAPRHQKPGLTLILPQPRQPLPVARLRHRMVVLHSNFWLIQTLRSILRSIISLPTAPILPHRANSALILRRQEILWRFWPTAGLCQIGCTLMPTPCNSPALRHRNMLVPYMSGLM